MSDEFSAGENVPAVKCLIAANAAVYALQILWPGVLERWCALWPWVPIGGRHYFHGWQIISYAFLHGTGNVWHLHLLFNMVGLWTFGGEVEYELGSLGFGVCYTSAVVLAGVIQLLLPPLLGAPPAPIIGASGGVFGLLAAYAMLFPTDKMPLEIPFLRLPDWLFVRAWALAVIYVSVELYLALSGRMPEAAHFAHLGGTLGGLAALALWRGRRRSRSVAPQTNSW